MRAIAPAITLLSLIALPALAFAESDRVQQAISYIFTGRIDLQSVIQIVDRKRCVVVVSEPEISRSTRYYLSRFKMETARFEKRYVGRTPSYQLYVEGDENVVEFLSPDKTVSHGHRSARIPLPGEIDESQRALRLVAEQCKPEKPGPLF